MVKVEVVIKDADYGDILYRFLPKMLAGMKDKEDASKIIQILSGMSNMPGTVAKAALAVLPQDVKDDLLVKVIDSYNEELKKKVNESIQKQGISCEVRDIWASKA